MLLASISERHLHENASIHEVYLVYGEQIVKGGL